MLPQLLVNLVETFKRLIDIQEALYDLSCNSPGGQLDNFDELFGWLKSKLVDIDVLQTIRDNLITLFEIQGLVLKPSKPEVPSLIFNVVLDLEPLLELVV